MDGSTEGTLKVPEILSLPLTCCFLHGGGEPVT